MSRAESLSGGVECALPAEDHAADQIVNDPKLRRGIPPALCPALMAVIAAVTGFSRRSPGAFIAASRRQNAR